MIFFNENKLNRFRQFLPQKIDFESQNFVIFDNFYSTDCNTKTFFKGWIVGFGCKGRSGGMCDGVL